VKQVRKGYKLEVDIHGMRREEAKQQLKLLLSRVDDSVSDVVVIHGYNQGTALLDMVRNELEHSRIKQKFAGLNKGETLLLIKPKQKK
jgi:DNA-nicking Smr family endonuclease